MYKFRTMTTECDSAGNLLPDSSRLTGFGNFLRLTSLDELPALWNVIRGEMSLVGPRPLLLQYTEFFEGEEVIRLTVRPGITGWAQINGRNDTPWDDRLGMDVWYVRHRNVWLDLRIIAMTLAQVFRREGVIVDPGSIMLNLDDQRRQRSSSS